MPANSEPYLVTIDWVENNIKSCKLQVFRRHFASVWLFYKYLKSTTTDYNPNGNNCGQQSGSGWPHGNGLGLFGQAGLQFGPVGINTSAQTGVRLERVAKTTPLSRAVQNFYRKLIILSLVVSSRLCDVVGVVDKNTKAEEQDFPFETFIVFKNVSSTPSGKNRPSFTLSDNAHLPHRRSITVPTTNMHKQQSKRMRISS